MEKSAWAAAYTAARICLCWLEPMRCDACLELSKRCLGGAMFLRGYLWARRVGRRVELRDRAWPAFEGRCAEIARRRARDSESEDPRLVEYLAEICHAAASQEWERADWAGIDQEVRAEAFEARRRRR